MKFSGYLLLLVLFSICSIFSQNLNKSVVSLPLNNERLKNKYEIMNLPILHITEDRLITLLTSKELTVLNFPNTNDLIIGEYIPGDKFFIVSSKSDVDMSIMLPGEEIVFKDVNSVLVRNLSISEVDAIQLRLSVTEINFSSSFKNVRNILRPELVTTTDSLISQVTSTVNVDTVRYFIQSLQDFQTRFLFANTRDAVALWIKNQFLQMGFTDVVLDSFQYQGTWQKNVIATLPGIYEPEVFNIVGGHHDSYSSGDPLVFAPGADDNASGTAAVLEIARVIKANNYQPESTIKFITFAAEEYGLWGSKDYAEKALLEGMNIKIMINHDMISHTYYPANQSEIDINRYSGFDYLRDLAFYCIENYSVLTPSNGGVNSSGSDSHSFWQRGFPSVYFEETNFSPFYHSPADTIGNYNMEYCAEVIKSSCATLLMNIVMPTKIENYNLIDVGTGNSLLLMWSPNQSPDFESYKIYLGTQSGVYDSVYTTTDTLFTVNNLTEGNLYYVGVSVLDQDGFESLIVERSAIPLELPLSPTEFSAKPLWHQVELSWQSNNEYDFYGYNIYRSVDENQLGEKLNQIIYQDTIYVDNTASNGIYYYYTVKAVDSLLNESIDNTTLRSRVVSLDQGILIVDETADGDGSLMNPTDQEVDDYYDDLLSNFENQQYDLIEENEISLADLGAFSTIIWHRNSVQNFNLVYESKESIKQYLDFGGNFIFTGYRPARAFENAFGDPVVFGDGLFIFEYLKIDSAYFRMAALFNSALSLSNGYSSIFVDSSKTTPSDSYHLKYIESILANSEAENIFSFESYFDSSSSQGSLKGKPVGVEYIGTDFKTITLSFPLYYMKKEQAESFIQYILLNKFNEVMPVYEDLVEVPSSYNLFQNYPNPFNPSTKIKYTIPEDSFVKLAIYNMLGEEVATIVNATQKAGRYEVNFNASELSSGVYVYRIEAGNFISSKKLILLK